MQFIFNNNKIYQAFPPFSEVGEVIEVGNTQLINMNITEVANDKTDRTRRSRMPKVRPDLLGPGGETGNLSERVQPEMP